MEAQFSLLYVEKNCVGLYRVGVGTMVPYLCNLGDQFPKSCIGRSLVHWVMINIVDHCNI